MPVNVGVEEPRSRVVGEESDGELILCTGANGNDVAYDGVNRMYTVLLALRLTWNEC